MLTIWRKLRSGVFVSLMTVAVPLAACTGTGDERNQARPASPTASPPSGTAVPRTPNASSVPTPRAAGDVATGLDVPWGLDFLPNGDALVAERGGDVVRVGSGGQTEPVGQIQAAEPSGEGGLLGLAISPNFTSDRLVYLYYSTSDDNRIARATFRGGRLGEPDPILTGIPSEVFHDGGRILFGPDGMLYASTGDAGVGERAQDLDSLGGKILRMTPDGEPAPGNPFRDSLVYSYGHRNVEGLAFDSAGRLWASEFGENTWDELNLIRPGENYGWPEVEGRGRGGRFVDPVAQWSPAEASPSGIAIADDVIYMAALRGERLWQIPIRGNRVAEPRSFLTGTFGRLRTVVRAPDNTLWVTTSNLDGRGAPQPGDDRILRIRLR